MGCYGIGINRIIAAAVESRPRRERHHLAAVAGPLRSPARPVKVPNAAVMEQAAGARDSR